MSASHLSEDKRFIWPRGGIANHVERLRTKWPQAWVSRERSSNGLRLVALPGFELPPGWNKTVCTVLWLARTTVDDEHVGSRLDGFYVDLPDIRLADGSHPHYSRSASDVHIPGFPHWRDLTRFWWKAQMWDPNRDNLYTHAMLIRQRMRPAR